MRFSTFLPRFPHYGPGLSNQTLNFVRRSQQTLSCVLTISTGLVNPNKQPFKVVCPNSALGSRYATPCVLSETAHWHANSLQCCWVVWHVEPTWRDQTNACPIWTSMFQWVWWASKLLTSSSSPWLLWRSHIFRPSSSPHCSSSTRWLRSPQKICHRK